MKTLQEGDKVDVMYSEGMMYNCTLTHTPAGEGDLWGFRDETGRDFLINPYASTFEGFRESISGREF